MSSNHNVPQLKPGDLVAGRFRIVEKIGSGGFSVVYRAHQEAMNRFVALKVLKPTASSDEKIVERFRREALFASHLSHPNTITLFDYGHTDDGLCYIAMEYLIGTDLADVVQRGEPMELRRVWRILVQCCHSLAEAHRLGLVHRDLKPENIFLMRRDDQEMVKVLDFGVSKAISNFANAGPRTMAPLTQEGTVFGTPLYMAPEQAMAEGIAPSVDVYAMGHIAYEMITGRAAYADCTNAMDVMLKQINEPPLELPQPWSGTPFSPLITKCTQKEPEERIQNATKLLEHLLHDAFVPYMDEASRPSRTRSLPRMTTLDGPAKAQYTMPPDSPEETEEVYRWELDVLEETLAETRQRQEMRLVIIRGTPGTGRSNLLRAFLRNQRHVDGMVVAHRQSHDDNERNKAGLEADLACLTEGKLEGRGIAEIKRVLHKHYDMENPGGDGGGVDNDSAPIGVLGAQRESFLSRITVPFREAAQGGALIWGIEDLERIDTLTLAFLDYFFKDLQRRPAPLMIVATVYPDDLMRRPGLLRYTQGLLQATKPVARQLSLVGPGESKAGDESTSPPSPPAGFPTDGPASGSFMGDAIPTIDSAPDDLPTLVGDEPSDVRIFDELDGDQQAEPRERDEADVAFDTVLGFLAELGDEVPTDLWAQASTRVLPSQFTALADFITEQAERFGIIQLHDQLMVFAQPGFADDLRDSFDELVDPVPTHLEIAALLLDYYDEPDREQLRNIVRHLRIAQAPYEAIQLLDQAGEAAFRAFDLDSARDYYLQIRQLLEDIDSGRVVAGEGEDANFDKARIWVRLGEIHGALGEQGAAEDAVNRALAPETGASPEQRGRAFKILGDLAVSQERYTSGKVNYRRARDSFREAGHPGAFVAAMGAMGHCAMMESKLEEAEEILSVALQRAKRLNNNVLGARLARFMGQVLARRGRFGGAASHLQNSLKIFERIDSQKEVVETLVELGDTTFGAGEFDASRKHFTRAISMAAAHHTALDQSPNLGLARALAAGGDLDGAGGHLAEALADASASGDRLRAAHVHFLMGDLALARQQFGQAIQHFQEVETTAQNLGQTRLRLDASIRRSYLAFDSGAVGDAYQQLSKTMQMAESTGDAGGELLVRAHVIYLQLLEHDFRTRGATFASLVDKSKDQGLTRARVLCQFFKADVHAARGEFDEARRLLEHSRLGASELGDFSFIIPIARRDHLLGERLGQPGRLAAGRGWALGALIPPEIGQRRFDETRLGQ